MLSEYGCRHIVLAQADRRGRKKTDRRDACALAELLKIKKRRGVVRAAGRSRQPAW